MEILQKIRFVQLQKAARSHAAQTAKLRDLAWSCGDTALGLFYGDQLNEQVSQWQAITAERAAAKVVA